MTQLARSTALLIAVGVAGLAGCGSDGGSGDPATTGSTDLSGSITVSAAASLTEAFTTIGEDFEAAHPGTEVEFNFDSSGSLAQQIVDGAPADVYASADEATMAELTDADLVADQPEVFARNQLVIVAQPGNPEGIETLEDLADAGVISLCVLDVPCGTFAAQVLEGAGVEIPESSITRGQNVKATLTAVSEGDAVAGIVYVTDAQAAGSDQVASVAIPEAQNVIARYPIATLSASGNPALAESFLAAVRGDEGQAVLKEAGFLPPA